MSTTCSAPVPAGPDTLVTVKIAFNDHNRRFKLALRDLGAQTLPLTLRLLLQIPADTEVFFERFSDSAGRFVALDSSNPAVYKQLYRAAKAKLKLRLKATTVEPQLAKELVLPDTPAESAKRNTYLETVLSHPVSTDEPVPETSFLRTVIDKVAVATAMPPNLSRPTLPTMSDFPPSGFSIDCNNCGITVSGEHYHCSQCEMGDFDLCPQCIEGGVSCHEDEHWLIKRTIKNGRVYTSSTETVEVKVKAEPVVVDVPTAPSFVEEQRTCNSCIIQLKASEFVTCHQCSDYDLCFDCIQVGDHGHHPMHTFAPVEPTSALFTPYIKTACQGGRGLKHDAVCDGCNAAIMGVRHKCLNCPDFDFCSSCVRSAHEIHPEHRFARIYEHLGPAKIKKEVHQGDDMRHLDDKSPSPVEKMAKANRSNVLTEPLEPGKTAVFTVLLKSPARDGRSISYWRLKTEEGLPFGHKLWCDISVAEQADPLMATPVQAKEDTTVLQAEDVSCGEAEKSQASSIMVFPKLDKESPASSIHETKHEIEAEPSVAASEEQDLLDDLDSMALEDELTDDGFMTDEEYDILEAEN